jgi:hypothetical protein
MVKYSNICFGFFTTLAIIDLIACGIMYTPMIETENHNQLMRTYNYYQDCLVYNESDNDKYYNLLVNNSYYQIYDIKYLKINTTVDCYISYQSNIAYLYIHYFSNQIAIILLLTGLFGLFIIGSLTRICIETRTSNINKKFKSKIANQVLQIIQRENYSTHGNMSLYDDSNIDNSNVDNINNNENTKLLNKDDTTITNFYDISLIRAEYENYNIGSNNNTIKCNICNKNLTIYVKICLDNHWYCHGCILNIDKDVCILCQKPINVQHVTIMT